MGLFSFITDLFSSSGKGKPKNKKKTAAKKAATAKKSKKETSVKVAKKKAPKATAKKKTAKKSPTKDIGLTVAGKKGKKRKKSRQVSADPIDADALGFSISLKDDDERAKKRNALRIRVEGLTVLVKRLGKQFPVTDISATGLGFAFEKPRVKGGVKLEMDLILNGETKIAGLEAKVMRHERGSVGCIFQELDRAQDDTVHAIVLLGQKQQSARKRAKKDREFKIPE